MDINEVILVDEQDSEIGSIEKLEAHERGLLHRAYSVFIINYDGKMLLQRRALSKYHSTGLWTNACCSHPAPGELTLESAKNRLQHEMGFQCALIEVDSFIYKTAFENGLTEHEFDHVLLGVYNGPVLPHVDEADDYKWVPFDELEFGILHNKDDYTFWFHIAYPIIRKFLK
ncbi:MAG: isopentenyl-diphosphate Delta-isomerase, partial [Pyrinomonadaceae bacterium]|nr:isopentenyl-diphosphate Delta-isomerase [Sphingobacteriaceae bacterium]